MSPRTGRSLTVGPIRPASGTGLFLCLLFLLAVPPAAMAQAIESGVAFLTATQEADGGWTSIEVRRTQATTTALEALQAVGNVSPARGLAADFLETAPIPDTDDRSRRIAVLAAEGRDVAPLVIQLLADSQSAQSGGGWGLTPDFSADPLDTSLALTGLAAAGQTATQEAFSGLVQLVESQGGDGGWACVAQGDSDLSCTARSLLTLTRYRDLFRLDDQVVPALGFLQTGFQADGSIVSPGSPADDTVFTTALAARALLAAGDELPGRRALVQGFLESAQAPDGSWGGDPFLTAVVVTALQAFQTAPFCGDGARNTSRESCDTLDLGGTSCQDLGFGPGDLACDATCGFDTSGCAPPPVCGDGEINQAGEACDDLDLGGESCESLGFGGGDLGCTDRCTFDTGACTILPECGDGIVNQASEVCDGLDLGGASCESLGLGTGTLSCRSDCRFDAQGCSAPPICGDGVVNRPTERCDGGDLGGLTCESFGGSGGSLGCLSDCTNFEVSGCSDLPDDDLDGFPAGADCDDQDPEVNPAQEEIPLNLKDDDCDLRTPDVLAECGVEVVFTMDTSGSMNDDAGALCSRISQVESSLAALGIDAQTHLLGISQTRGGSFSCLTNHVRALLGGTVPGDDGRCDGFLNQSESWGQATAIVADRFPWTPGSIRVVVPISDEGPCNGNFCSITASDRDSVVNAGAIALANEVFVSPIVARGGNSCVSALATEIADTTGGTVFFSTNPDLDLPTAIANLLVGACEETLVVELDPALAVNPPGTSHALTVTVTDALGFLQDGRQVAVRIDSGPHAGDLGTALTGSDGTAPFEYLGSGALGVDRIVASVTDSLGRTVQSSPALKLWDADCNENGVADTCDLDCNGFDSQCSVIDTCGRSADVNGDGSPDECLLPSAGTDDDDDDFPASNDCDDQDPAVNPGATEIPGNGVDDDCNPATPDDIPDGLVSCTVVTDQVAYGAQETIGIEVVVENAADSLSLAGLAVDLTVDGPEGVLEQALQPLAPLAPGELRQVLLEASTGTIPPGPVSVQVGIVGGDTVLAFCTAATEILPSTERGVLLTGAIEADPDEILVGEEAAILYSVTNSGNVPLDPAFFDILVVDVDSEEVLATLTDSAPLVPGETVDRQRPMPELPVGDYILVLRGGAVTPETTLASTGFRVVNAPPDCSGASATPDSLWPPNHLFVDVVLGGVTDPDGDEVTLTVTGVFQDEPVEGQGDGSFCPDASGVGTSNAQVRAERSGLEDGRVYRILFTADDGRGGQCEGEATVCVPHDRQDACGDQGALFDSTQCEEAP